MSAQPGSNQLELYQQVILEHNRKPKNYYRIEEPTHLAEGLNPLCGDHIHVFMKLEDDCVSEVSFSGSGCAISKASASIMTSLVKGKSRAEALILFDGFQKLLTGTPWEEIENLPNKLKVFTSIWNYPSRVKCAALAWHALNGAISKQETVSTE